MTSTYQSALDYLYGFANFEHKRINKYTPERIDPGRPGRLLALLGDPHQQFPTIHVAGTKGKGSVAAMAAFALRAAGLRVGLYTSPHLMEFRERIRVLTPADADGRISEEELVALVTRLKPAAAEVAGLTWFELVTALAFLHFAHQNVDAVVVEVGLGGRLDATNIITPLVSVITSLSLDHTDLLGNTLAEIAGEKGGIIKPGIPVVVAPQQPEALDRLRRIAQERAAPLILVGRDWRYETLAASPAGQTIIFSARPAGPAKTNLQRQILDTPLEATIPLAGEHQQENAAVALAALVQVADHFPGLDRDALQTGFASVQWPGRLQIVPTGQDRPTLLVDCAHNADSAGRLAQALAHVYQYRRLWLVIGATADKDMAGILRPLLPLGDQTIMTRSTHPRAADPAELARLAGQLGYTVTVQENLSRALAVIFAQADAADLICVTGSIFMVGDLLNQWERIKSSL